MKDYSPTIFRLVEYEIWCNLRALDLLTTLSDEECKRDLGFGCKNSLGKSLLQDSRPMDQLVNTLHGPFRIA